MPRRAASGGKRSAAPSRRVVVLTLPEFDLLDFAGPSEVFFAANRTLAPTPDRPPAYVVETVSSGRTTAVKTACGLEIAAHHRLKDETGPIDTLLVPAAAPAFHLDADSELLDAVRRLAARSRRVASVCAGALVLAAAGLLNGRRATTHWAACAELARRFPFVRVEPDPIFVRDGNVYTSAGSTAGMDLALALVEEDHGRATAAAIARLLVMFARRPGGQSQFSPLLEAQASERESLSDLVAWIAGRLDDDLSVERLAKRACMSVRNFARVFRRETGRTPARYVERLRLDDARRRLEETSDGLEEVARASGFGSADSLRRSFLRVLKVSPGDYRERFRVAPRD